MTVSDAARILGQRGGSVKSERKAAAARRNGLRGGRPKINNAQIEQFASKVIANWQALKNK